MIPHNLDLLRDNSTVADGDWRNLLGARNPAIQVDGIVAGDIIQIEVSNSPDPDDSSAIVDQLGDDITEDGIYQIDPGPKWIRAARSDISGSGDVTVILSYIEYIS